MKHIVDVSGGNASAVALLRVIERYGRGDVVSRFADTRTESPDLYRFLGDLERVAQVTIERLSDGRTIWDVFRSEAMWTNPQTGGCIASWHLKRKVLESHLQHIGATPGDTTIYVGFDASEQDRMDRLTERGKPWRFEFPLTWKPWLLRCDQEDYLRRRGLVPCEMYDRGYSHANCGGTCVLAGIKQWAMVARDYPERYAEAERVEAQVMAEMQSRGRKAYSILRKRVGGKSASLTLTELRQEIEAGNAMYDDDDRLASCSCVGDLFSETEAG